MRPTFPVVTALLPHWQRDQNIHDNAFHRDIANQTPKERITHACLHFSKYVGRLAEHGTAPSPVALKTVTDTALIALGAANALNLKLQGEVHATLPCLREDEVLKTLAIRTGRFADSIEKDEHLEEGGANKRETLVEIIHWTLAAANLYGMDLATAIEARRRQIRDSREPLLGLRAIA